MSGAGSRHPGFDGDTGSIPFGDLWSSISRRRVAAVDAAMGATVFVQRLSGECRVRKQNKSGAFCWERDLSRGQAKAIVKDALETSDGSIELGEFDDLWPDRSGGYGGEY